MKALAMFADGMEESEGLIVVDMMLRAGIHVKTVSIKDDLVITGSHGIKIVCDETMEEADFDGAGILFLPGGKKGTDNLASCKELAEKILEFDQKGKRLAAVCAAPSVYGRMGLLKGRKATCYPGFEEDLTGAKVSFEPCIVDGNVITGRGMGCAIDFSLAIITELLNVEEANELAAKIIYR